ncbi:MAG: patatin-like phospholipase family protein [Christensenellaceae bacterium]|jgi:predicted patatin/cPLA2 family phospholipase
MAKTGLVLEGGGMHGIYSAGVLDAFLDLGIEFLDIIGVSAGACNALSYISKQYKRNLNVYTTYAPDDRYLSFKSYLKTGSFFGMQFVFYEVPQKLIPFDYDTYAASPQKLTIVATNFEDGKPFYKEVPDMRQDMIYICATSAIPMASRVIRVDGHQLMDGGASDSIPIEYSMRQGNAKNVVVLTRNEGFRAKKSKLSFMPHLFYPRHRAFAGTVANRAGYYNKSLDICEAQQQEGNAIVIRPVKPLTVDRFERDPQKLAALYYEGYNDTMAKKEELLTFLSGSDNVNITPPRD